MKKNFIILLNLLVLANLSLATASSTSVQTLDNKAPIASKKIAVALSTTMSTNTSKDVENQSSNSQAISLSYKLPYGIKTSLSVSGNQDLRNDREYTLSDTSLKFSKSFGSLSRDMTISGAVTTYIPTSETSYKTKGLTTGVKVSGTLVYDASRELIKKLTLVYVPTVRVNLFKYKIATNGASNTLVQATNTVVLSYSINKKLGISLANTYIRNWTHEGNTNDIFAFDQSLSYDILSNVSATVGHSVAGPALAANGKDSGLTIYDEDLSSYYLSVGYTY